MDRINLKISIDSEDKSTKEQMEIVKRWIEFSEKEVQEHSTDHTLEIEIN